MLVSLPPASPGGWSAAARRSFEVALASVQESLQAWITLGNQPYEAASLSQLAHIHLRLGNLPAAEHHANAACQIRESLGLNDAWNNYNTLSEIAAARQDPAAAATLRLRLSALFAVLVRNIPTFCPESCP